jgi:alcohol dehydrogenase
VRAAVVYQHGPRGNIILEANYPEPALHPEWVRLRVRACSVNYHDIFSRRGMPGIKLPLPLIIGSDIAGEVVELGPEVRGAAVGDRVLLDPVFPPLGMIGERYDGGRAELCAAHSSQLVPIPDELSFEAAASIPLAYATAYRMMVTRAQVRPEDVVLILGASGGVGTASVLLAKLVGATVIACANSPDKLRRLGELGADHLINYAERDMREAVWEIVGKPRISGAGGVDLVVNCTGRGTWIDSTRFEEQIDIRYIWTFEHTLLGSNGWRRSDITALIDHAARGSLKPVIDRVMALDEVHEAERLMEDRQVFGKIVLVP